MFDIIQLYGLVNNGMWDDVIPCLSDYRLSHTPVILARSCINGIVIASYYWYVLAIFPWLVFISPIFDNCNILVCCHLIPHMFLFQYAILLTVVLHIFVKYILHRIDLQSENPWDNKAVYLLYTELVLGECMLTLTVLNFWKFTSYCSLKPLWSGMGGSSAGSYLADPTSPIPSHSASIFVTSTLRVNSYVPHKISCAFLV